MEKAMAPPVQYSCLENPMDGGAWWAAFHGVAKRRTRLSNFTFPFHFHALEKEMATHSSILAWRIPGMGGDWWAAVYGVTQGHIQLKWLGSSSLKMHTHTHSFRSWPWQILAFYSPSLCLQVLSFVWTLLFPYTLFWPLVIAILSTWV